MNEVLISLPIKGMHTNEESTNNEVDAVIEKEYRKAELGIMNDVKLTVEFPKESGEEDKETIKYLKEMMEFLTFEKVKRLQHEEEKHE